MLGVTVDQIPRNGSAPRRWLIACVVALSALGSHAARAESPPVVSVEGQPLAANARRTLKALEFLGAPLPGKLASAIDQAATRRDAAELQKLLDPQVLFVVSLNPEVRVKVARGPAKGVLQQTGYTPVLVKVLNDSTVTERLRIVSPQAGPVYAGASRGILARQAQTELNDNENVDGRTDRIADVEMFAKPPMTTNLSGLEVEYAIALIYCSEPGKREITVGFDVGAGNQDLGFRGETPVLFDVRPALPVRLTIRDADGSPTVARLTFRDRLGRVYPPQAKRLAPDFFFQPQVYRADGDVVRLPPGEYRMAVSRGPEYRVLERVVTIPEQGKAAIDVRLERWIDPMRFGFFCGDHHIHGAGCSHYAVPTLGVDPSDMFLQVKGEGLNVGCVLTWGPCFDHQRQFFAPTANALSEPFTVLKYDLEISGFGSAALGHVCLLNLKDQTYPGSAGTTKGWPTWTVPVLRWAKEQGGVTGYPHSAMHVDAKSAGQRLLERFDADDDARLERDEAAGALLPEPFADVDNDKDGRLTIGELTASVDRAADRLPNLAVPAMNGVGAMEICVSTAEGVCDFISAMDTARIPEWNCWYHLLNCGFPLKLSGETDFPCMSSRRVGQGRVYVQLGAVDRVDFADWCTALARGQSYVSDGFAHALGFTVQGRAPGEQAVRLDAPGRVTVRAKVAFAAEQPRAVAYGGIDPPAGKRMIGDTINLHAPRTDDVMRGGDRLVEVVINGVAKASAKVPADGKIHDLQFPIEIDRSSWVALRQFPQLHTNPVDVLVAGEPIRVSRDSARWCIETIELLWKNRKRHIAERERDAAERTYRRAIDRYRRIASEAPQGS